jgi:alpha-L-fucosidase
MAAKHPEAQWFKEAKFGVFIHWGPYSVKEIEASWPLQPHHKQYIPVDEYEALAQVFHPENYEPKEWARMAKEAGAKYVVLTAKHHDGYCLFDTKTTDYCATKTGPGRDLVAPYAQAVREAGLKVGLYFTTIDWHDPDFATIPIAERIRSPKPFEYDPIRWHRFHQRFVEQLRELLTNYGKIDLIWFDVPGFGADRWRSHEVKQMMLNLQPHLVINNRLPDAGDYITPEQYIPFAPPNDWWETCMTMNHQWAYHSDPSQYKDMSRLIRDLSIIAGKGGNLLLNVGPKPDGTWPAEAKERLDMIGQWLAHSGEGIYGTERGPNQACFYGPMTRKGNTLYLHVLETPRAPIEIRGIHGTIKQARLLRTGEQLESRFYGRGRHLDRLEIDLPAGLCDPWNSVIAVEFEDEPEWP